MLPLGGAAISTSAAKAASRSALYRSAEALRHPKVFSENWNYAEEFPFETGHIVWQVLVLYPPSQLVALQLSSGGLGQLGKEFYPTRPFENGQAAHHKLLQLARQF